MAGCEALSVDRNNKSRAPRSAGLSSVLALSVFLSTAVFAQEIANLRCPCAPSSITGAGHCAGGRDTSEEDFIFPALLKPSYKKLHFIENISACPASLAVVDGTNAFRPLNNISLKYIAVAKTTTPEHIRPPPRRLLHHKTDFSDTRFFPSRPPETGILAAVRATIRHIYITEIRSNRPPEFVVSAHKGAIIEGVV